MDLPLNLVVRWAYRWCPNVNGIVWGHYLVMSLNNWSLVMNKSQTWMHCRCSWPRLWSWLMASCDWVGGGCAWPASPLITLQDQGAISWGWGGGGWEVFSVAVSLHQHQRQISMPCLSASGCILPSSSSSPHLPVCAWKLAVLRRERERGGTLSR